MNLVKHIFKDNCDKYSWDIVCDHTVYDTRTMVYNFVDEPYMLFRNMFLIQLSAIEDIR